MDYRIQYASLLLRESHRLETAGDYARALEAAQKALWALDAPGEDGSAAGSVEMRFEAWTLTGALLRQLARYAEAEPVLRRCLAMAVESFGEADDRTSMARNQLGVLFKYTGNFEEAEDLYRKALSHLTARHGEMHGMVATLEHNLGGLFHARGDYEQAEPHGRKAWEINRALLGEDDVRTIADAAAYAGILDGLKRFDESEKIYRRALEAFERHYGHEHYEVAVNLNNLANVRSRREIWRGRSN